MDIISDICPYCGAKLKLSKATNIVKCEYCDSEIVIRKGTAPVKEIPVPQQTAVSDAVDTEKYFTDLKKWKKITHRWELIYAVLTVVFVILIDSEHTGAGVLCFVAWSTVFWAAPSMVASKKPLSPNEKKISKMMETLKLYGKFLTIGFITLIIAAIMIFT